MHEDRDPGGTGLNDYLKVRKELNMSEITKKDLEENKNLDALNEEQVEQVSGGGDPLNDDGVTTWDGAILLPEVPAD